MNTETLEQHYNRHRSAESCGACSEYFDRVYPRVSDHAGSTVLFAGIVSVFCLLIVLAWQLFSTVM